MIEIKTPDGGVARFPDGTPDATIKAAMRKAYGGPQVKQGPSVAEDIATTLPGQLLTGVAAIPGAIGDLPALLDKGVARVVGYATGRTADEVQAEARAFEQTAPLPMIPKPWEVIGTQKILDAVEPVTGKLPQPQTTAGKYVGAVASMAPAAAIGPGGIFQRGAQAVVPGVASEGAGQAFEGTAAEPWARALAAIVAGGGTAVASRQGVPERMVSQAMGGAVDDAVLTQAARLQMEARRQGIELSWPEAIQQITNSGTRLTDLQRVVENSAGGGPIMRDFYADRPAQVDAAARQQFDQIAPQPIIPERLGPRVQQAADADISNVNRYVNDQTRPMYRAAETQTIPANSPALQDPAFQQAVAELRNNPVLGPRFANLPDNSIGVIDAAQKLMRSRAEALQVPGQGLNPYEASVTRQARRNVTNEARNQSPEYDAAVQNQRQLRDEYLNPLEQGPTGRLAGTADVRAQGRALFPSQPAAQSEAGVSRAMRGIRQTDPEAAAGIVRQHLESVFNEAAQRLQSGQNPAGGAKFSAVAAGNPQQRRNLIAAIRALPNGHVLWRGFNRFLDILEATGKRPATNSMTDFNAQIRKDLEQGPLTQEVATIAASPQKALTFISDGYKRFRLGQGTADLARLFTTGNLDDFRAILQNGPSAPRTIAAMVRLIGQANVGAQTGLRSPAN